MRFGLAAAGSSSGSWLPRFGQPPFPLQSPPRRDVSERSEGLPCEHFPGGAV